MSDENNVLLKIWQRLADKTVLFRVNSGSAWASGGGKPVRLKDGSVNVPAARPIAMGFSLVNRKPVSGVADLVGWSSVFITQEMVGKKVAVFTSIEAKNSKGGRRSPEQIKWSKDVNDVGGIAGFANSPDEAERIVVEWHENIKKV